METYLVTGAAGFIGRSIAAELLARGKKVRGIDNFVTGKRENLLGLEAMDFIEADINDTEAVARACRGVECIFHEAAIPSVPRSIEDPVASNHAGVSGTVQLLVAAKNAKVRRVVYAGSSSVYGNTPTLPKSEQMQPSPISPYAVAKLAGELYMQSFTRVYGLETVVIRYFNVFGPWQDPTSHYSGILAIFTMKMLAGETPTIYGDGEQSRDFTFIQNVVHGNLLASEASAERVSGKVFNIATGNRVTLNQTVEILRRATGYTGEVRYAAERSGDVKHSLADISRAKECFGYEPLVSFNEGIERTVAWYKAAAETAIAHTGSRR
ncbi:MAG: SDR family oxidoreductase [Terracidiphilus sp.]|jgi:UDP-glucose 4-epimerase